MPGNRSRLNHWGRYLFLFGVVGAMASIVNWHSLSFWATLITALLLSPSFAALCCLVFPERRSVSTFLFMWGQMAFWECVLAFIPAGYKLDQDWAYFIAGALTLLIIWFIWWWRRRKDRLRSLLLASQRELAKLASMVRTMRQRWIPRLVPQGA